VAATWREIPVLEAILRLNRRRQLATPAQIADEAVLHLGDVYDSIAALVSAGIVNVADSPSEGPSDAIVVTLTGPLESVLRLGIIGSSTV
jgi:hypothetical protein